MKLFLQYGDQAIAWVIFALLIVGGITIWVASRLIPSKVMRRFFSWIVVIEIVLTVVIGVMYNLNSSHKLYARTFSQKMYTQMEVAFPKGYAPKEVNGTTVQFPIMDSIALKVKPTPEMVTRGWNASMLFGVMQAHASIGDGDDKIVFTYRAVFHPPYLDWEIGPPDNWPGTEAEFYQWFQYKWKERYAPYYIAEQLGQVQDLSVFLRSIGYPVAKPVTKKDLAVTVEFADPQFEDGQLDSARSKKNLLDQYNQWKSSMPN